jgi:hypothetical protein
MMKKEGSGSISQRHGSADPDPDPHQNVMDLQTLEECEASLQSFFSSNLLWLPVDSGYYLGICTSAKHKYRYGSWYQYGTYLIKYGNGLSE